MRLIDFPEANQTFQPPEGWDTSQCSEARAFVGEIKSGTLDGAIVVIVAWQPEPEDIARIIAGGAVYVSCLGTLPPHRLSTEFGP